MSASDRPHHVHGDWRPEAFREGTCGTMCRCGAGGAMGIAADDAGQGLSRPLPRAPFERALRRNDKDCLGIVLAMAEVIGLLRRLVRRRVRRRSMPVGDKRVRMAFQRAFRTIIMTCQSY